jgi:hypothetical protein
MSKKIYIIETISTHRLVYAIETDKDINDPNVRADLENALPAFPELKQIWIGEHISSIADFPKSEFIQTFDNYFPECKDMSKEEKLLSIEDYDNFIPEAKDVI